MQIVSAYLLKQVGDVENPPSPEPIAEKKQRIIQQFIDLGNHWGNDAWYAWEKKQWVKFADDDYRDYEIAYGSVQAQIKNETTTPTGGDGSSFYYGISELVHNIYNLKVCFYIDSIGQYTHGNTYIREYYHYKRAGGSEGIGSSAYYFPLYTQDYTDQQGRTYKALSFETTIPIFQTQADANTYMGAVDTFINSLPATNVTEIENAINNLMIG